MSVILSLLAASAYGVGDFFGAIATRRSNPIFVSFIGHIFYATVAFVGLLVFQGTWTNAASFSGIVTGACEAIGFLVFYYALTVGRVAVVAPLVSVIYAIVPVFWGIASGDRLSILGWCGVVLGLVAVFALSLETEVGSSSNQKPIAFVVLLCVFGGAMWGLSTVALSYAPKNSGMVPVFLAGLTAFALLAATVLVRRVSIREALPSGALSPSVWSGLLFGLANLFIISALRFGSLSLVGLITALYPLATVLLARIFLKELINRVQWFGIGSAILAAVLLSQG